MSTLMMLYCTAIFTLATYPLFVMVSNRTMPAHDAIRTVRAHISAFFMWSIFGSGCIGFLVFCTVACIHS